MSIWDSYQELRVKHAIEDIVPANVRTSELGVSVGRLETELTSDVDKLTLLCQALWSLLEENTELTLEDLESKIHALEALDEKLLEELGDLKQSCPRCNAAIPVNMDKCQFCGYEV
jgi:predicted Zn-ribbon and HTH transcriptional regulator